MAHGDTNQARSERIVSLADARHCSFRRNVRRIRVQVRRLAAGPNFTCGCSDGADAQPNTGYPRSRRRTHRPTRDRPRKKHSELSHRRQSEPKCARPLAPALYLQSRSRQLTSIPMHCRVRMNRPRPIVTLHAVGTACPDRSTASTVFLVIKLACVRVSLGIFLPSAASIAR